MLKILTCVPVETVRARSRFAWKQAQRCVRPCGTPCTLSEECQCTPHKHGVRTHQHMSTGTCTAHHALHRVSRILNIPTVLPRISRLHLLDIRTLASPTTIQLTTQTHIHTSHTHEQTKGRQTACAVVPSLSDTLADCATVRQLQHHFSVAKSVTSTARQDVSMHRCYWKHKVGKRPAPSRNRSPTLSQTVRGHRHSPNTISRRRWQNLLRPPPAPRCAHASV